MAWPTGLIRAAIDSLWPGCHSDKQFDYFYYYFLFIFYFFIYFLELQVVSRADQTLVDK